MNVINDHPILRFKRGRKVQFYHDGKLMEWYENDPIAVALQANGVKILSYSKRFHRPRGFFCAIGKCSSCFMRVDGLPNVRTCITPLREGMRIETQHGIGEFLEDTPSDVIDQLGQPLIVETEVLVIGAGPAGLSTCLEAADLGCQVTLVDESLELGGQLIKQTHKFFGSSEDFAGIRGVKIAEILREKLIPYTVSGKLTIFSNTSAIGYYPKEDVVLCTQGEKRIILIKPKAVVVSSGAMEKLIPFSGNDLPGVYGAGAVQTLMNVYGVLPGKKVLMVGAGNIGLIVSYQLLQAGVKVAAIVELAPRVGGYWVHASKVQRLGVPILLQHTVKWAVGEKQVEGAWIQQVDEEGRFVGAEKFVDCDTICLAVGLTPTVDLLWQAGCEMVYVVDLGGYVPKRDWTLRTSNPKFWIAGDASAIGEATTAMLEGRIAGLSVSKALGKVSESFFKNKCEEYWTRLNELRMAETCERLRKGLQFALAGNFPITVQSREEKSQIFNKETYADIFDKPIVQSIIPPMDLWKKRKGGLVIIECPQRIPCDPCHVSCPTGAILPFQNINDLPSVDYSKCTGCAMCVAACPGLACFVADMTGEQAILKLPYEMLPIPKEGNVVACLDRSGRELARSKVRKVQEPRHDRTFVVHVQVPKELVMLVRALKVIEDE
ncbi:FAD-dependent oxidoreductase [Pseudothermotoga sp.]|uniref:FAD-dependent oxidoreductase n=1 Tax=Pseudothermotoga sp. TaxID=2033661 RepID=UPI0031F660A4